LSDRFCLFAIKTADLTREPNDHQPKKTIFESLYERRFTRRFVASVEDARIRRNSKSSSAVHSALSSSSKDSFTSSSVAPNGTLMQNPVASLRRPSLPGKRISTDSKNLRGEEVKSKNSVRSLSVPYARKTHPIPGEETVVMADSVMLQPEADASRQLPKTPEQVVVSPARPSVSGTPRAGDLTLTSSDQTTPVPPSGTDLEGQLKSVTAENRVPLRTGGSGELPRKISTDVYRVPKNVPSLSSFSEINPIMAMTMSGSSFEDHLPTSFSLMEGSFMDEAAEFCHNMLNEQREVLGTHQRLPREVVERTDCRPQHTSIWGTFSRSVPTGKLTSPDSSPAICEVLRSEKSRNLTPAMANEIQLADNHGVSIQKMQEQARVLPMEQAFRPSTLDTCAPLYGTSRPSGRSSTVIPNFTDCNKKASEVEKAVGILSAAITEGASVVVPQVAADENEISCRGCGNDEDCKSQMKAVNLRSLELPADRGTFPDSMVMQPSPSTAKEYFMSAGGVSLQFLSTSIDPLTLSEASETLALSSLNPEGKEAEMKTAESIPVDSVIRNFFSINADAPTVLAETSSTTTSSTTSPAPASKKLSTQVEEIVVPLAGQLYKKRSYSSSAVDDDTEQGLKITDAILFKAFTPPFRFRIEGPSTQEESQFEKLDTSQSAQIILSADEEAAQDELRRKLGKLDAAVEKALKDIREKKDGLYELSYSLFQTCILTNEKIPEIKRRYRDYVLSIRSFLTNPEVVVPQELREELKEQVRVVVEEYIRLLDEKVMRQFWAPAQDKASMLRLKADFLRYLLELNPGDETYTRRCQMTYKDTKLFFVEHRLQKTVEWVYLQMNYAAFLYMTGALSAALYISRQLTKSPLLSRCSKEVQKRLQSNLKLYQML
uniref:Protein kinase domain-containing protein n=1 Tax=Schistocephalus solidus TaxID=70667 RepID=A0A183TMH6_SCHSO